MQNSKKPQVFGNSPQDLSFEGSGKSFLKKSAFSYLKFNLFAAAFTALTFSDVFNSNENWIKRDSGWVPNVKVFACTGQNTLGISTNKDSYTANLLDFVSKPEVKSLEQSNDSLIKKGYQLKKLKYNFSWHDILFFPTNALGHLYSKNKTFFPLQTLGVKLNIFDKQEKNKQRFVLSLYDGSEKRFKEETKDNLSTLKKIYNLSAKNIVKIQLDSLKNFEQGLDSVMGKINKLKNRKDVELLILYTGHGSAEEGIDEAKKVEGALNGIIVNENIKENQVKELFSKKLKGVKTLFVLDTCHSGAWIAENMKKLIKLKG